MGEPQTWSYLIQATMLVGNQIKSWTLFGFECVCVCVFVKFVKNKGMISSSQCFLYLLVMLLYLACSLFLWILSLSHAHFLSHSLVRSYYSCCHLFASFLSSPLSLWKLCLLEEQSGIPWGKKKVHSKHTPHGQTGTQWLLRTHKYTFSHRELRCF